MLKQQRAGHYSNILTILQPKNFQIENPDILHIPAQNIYCGYSLEPPVLTSTHNICGEAVLTSTHNICFVAVQE